jgi:trimethylamine:corrinoid methyltransferase-like protein
MVKEARAEVKRLLKEHEVAEIDKDIIREGDALIKAYEKEIAGRK